MRPLLTQTAFFMLALCAATLVAERSHAEPLAVRIGYVAWTPDPGPVLANTGLDSLRFIQPVRVGSRVRVAATLLDAYEKNPGQWLLKSRAVMEIEGVEKPAYIAETLALCVV